MPLQIWRRLSFVQPAISCLISALALLAVAGCCAAKVERLQPSSAGWRIQQGQATWRPSAKRPELSGDLLLATQNSGNAVFNFSKTPLPITAGQTTSTNWLIEFPARHFVFSGKGQPPTRFAWLYLDRALRGETLPANFRFSKTADGSWRLENLKSGEFIEGFLAP